MNIDFDDLLARFPDAESADPDTGAGRDMRAHASAFAPAEAESTGSGTGCGRVMVSRAQATMLSPAIVRQLACDADILPVVFGANGEILDLGRTVRLFSKPQRKALWSRDRHCSYPGCDAPAAWADAHHLIHWVDGGDSDLANATLLCQRHHTLVHDKRRSRPFIHPTNTAGA